MKLQLKFFASLREVLGSSEETLEVSAPGLTVNELRELLRQRDNLWADALATTRAIRVAVNHEVVDGHYRIEEAAEVAFFPPVTGG